MKYLSDYIQAEQSALLTEMGAFFAFSNEQFEEGVAKNKDKLLEGEKWASFGMGMYMPKHNVAEFNRRHAECVEAGVKLDLEENGRSAVLQRELGNYEIGLAFEAYNDPNFRDAIACYDFTEKEVEEEYRKHMALVEY